jgi:flagellar L-ring protein precursor FlgH
MSHARTLLVRAAIGSLALLSAPGCGPNHIQPFSPRVRDYKPGTYAQEDEKRKPAPGSLFSEAHPSWLSDARAMRVGDVLLITINENADASGTATTDLKTDSSMTSGAGSLLGIMPAIQKAYPGLDPTKLIDIASKSAFSGSGNTTRNGQLTGMIAVRVSKEMPNGDLFIEGTKVVLINHEEYHLYVSGLVRPSDIAQDNTVQSSRIADAQVEFTGRGDLNDQTRKGWLTRILDSLNPF